MVVIKKLKNYKKFIKGGYNETSIRDVSSWNNIDKSKIHVYEKKPLKVFYDNFLIVNSAGYILDKNGDKITDIISNEPLKIGNAFLLNGYLFDIKNLKESLSQGSFVNPLTREEINQKDIKKIQKFDYNNHGYRGIIYCKNDENIRPEIPSW
jgi:hypothetical protein